MSEKSAVSPFTIYTNIVAVAKTEMPGTCLTAIIRRRLMQAAKASDLDDGEPIVVADMHGTAEGSALVIKNPIDGQLYILTLRKA